MDPLKERHRSMWAMGDYPSVASHVIPHLGEVVVEAVGVGPGDRVLDVAAGTGNAAIPAALRGADVVASDLTPGLLEAGRKLAELRGARLTWREADAEALPFADGSFDAVLSCVGVMFAPHHEASAAELLRVCRRDGRIGLLSWTPDGFIGQMLATMRPYVAPPPAGVSPPPRWGDPEHVLSLLGDGVRDVQVQRRPARIDAFPDAAAFLGFFKAYYGPTVAAYEGLTEDQAQALDEELLDLARRHDLGDGLMEWEYLLLTARRT